MDRLFYSAFRRVGCACVGDGRGDTEDIANAAGGKPAAIYFA